MWTKISGIANCAFGFLSGERKVLPSGKGLSGWRGHTRPGWEQAELKITATLFSKAVAHTTPFVLSSGKAGRNVSLKTDRKLHYFSRCSLWKHWKYKKAHIWCNPLLFFWGILQTKYCSLYLCFQLDLTRAVTIALAEGSEPTPQFRASWCDLSQALTPGLQVQWFLTSFLFSAISLEILWMRQDARETR